MKGENREYSLFNRWQTHKSALITMSKDGALVMTDRLGRLQPLTSYDVGGLTPHTASNIRICRTVDGHCLLCRRQSIYLDIFRLEGWMVESLAAAIMRLPIPGSDLVDS
jgi:hypothetical protein